MIEAEPCECFWGLKPFTGPSSSQIKVQVEELYESFIRLYWNRLPRLRLSKETQEPSCVNRLDTRRIVASLTRYRNL